jgi:DNA-binding CsgD family transcriptional regulator
VRIAAVDAGHDRRDVARRGTNTFEIVGREAELASVRAFLDKPGARLAALVLDGEAGIGKSTLWLAGVEHARTRGLCVLSSRPAEAERALAHVGLSDLLENALDETLPALQTPRRRALEIVMLRAEPSGDPVDQRALAVAVRDVLQLLSGRGPVVIAVDDVQWLDPSSWSALAFAFRRLAANDIRVLLTRRPAGGAPLPGFEEVLGKESVHRVPVGPLSVGALHQLLRDRLGRPFARQTLLRIHERSGGNPFFALELARVLDVGAGPLEPLPVPATLEELLRARIAGLPAATREALALASALGTSSESLLARAGIAVDALGPAAAAHVIEREDGTVRFTHPLLSSVLYHDLGEKRRRVHGRIARSVEDPLVRARHLALSRDEPDAGVAVVLDEAVRLAVDRGALAVAAELAEHGVRLTPVDACDERRRRALAAARAHQRAGEWTRAQTIAAGLLAETEIGAWRAEALVLLSELEGEGRAAELLGEALREAASRPALQSLIHCRLAWVTRFEAGFDHAGAALELAEQLGDDVLRARARAVQAILGWFAGSGEAPADLAALAAQLPGAIGGERLVQVGMQAVVNTFAPSSRRDGARVMLEREHRQWCDRDEPRSARALWGLAWLEFWAGRWAIAAEYAAHAHDIAIQYGLEVAQYHLPAAVIAVHRGQLEVARVHSERALKLAEEQFGWRPPQHVAVLGLAALWSGDRPAAVELFDNAGRRAAALGWGEPSVRWWTADHAELLLELGRIDDAARIVGTWEADARRVAREWVLAHVTRCRGLAAAARGDVEQALDLLARAVAEHDAVGDPFGRARALLASGTIRRRVRQKRPAREAIEAAVGAFDAIGASRWAAKARGELGSVSGRRPADALTAAERRVAALAAEGKTNREVAAALFLGERTVASHLTHVYAKLGVRSRTELARRLQAGEPM